ncbi:hypothetical protein [Sorangium sp. So ce204]|uniref:hypothetical protein n=1 Tax=Sorangium sp. So ce204 TaxID=3133288 RepID=UPI003F6072DB
MEVGGKRERRGRAGARPSGIRGHVSRPLPGYPDEAPVGTFHSFSGDEDGEKIDFIFAQPAPVAEVLMAQIIREHRDGFYPSDHFPVTARLRLQP